MQYQMPAVKTPLTGVQQSYHLPVSQAPRRVVAHYQPTLANPSIHGNAAIVQQTYIFPVDQPRMRRGLRVRPGLVSIKGNAPPTTNTELTVFPTLQPDRYRWELMDQARYRRDVEPQIHAGVVPSTTFDPVATVTPSAQYWVRPPTPTPAVPILGAPTPPSQTDIFKLSDVVPQGYYGFRPAPKLIVRVIQGAVIPTPEPLALPLSPTIAWWTRLDTSRQSNVPVKSFTGATSQQTYVFPLSQPTAQFYARRTQAYPEPRLERAAAQQTYVFISTQPDRAFWYVDRRATQGPWTFKLFPTSEAVVTAPQTYVFDLSQLTLRSYTQARIQRTPDLSVKYFEGRIQPIFHPFKVGDDYTQPKEGFRKQPITLWTDYDGFVPVVVGHPRIFYVFASADTRFFVVAKDGTSVDIIAQDDTAISVKGSET